MRTGSLQRYTRRMHQELKHYAKRERGYWLLYPGNLLLFMTYRCTSRCRTCTLWRRPAQEGELTLEEWKRFIDEVAPYGIDSVELFGGDALLRKDVTIPLAGHISRKGIRAELPTNCNLLDLETIRALDRNGLSTYYVSLDGLGSTHDEIRGVPGTFEKVARAIPQIRSVRGNRPKPLIILLCTISKLNVEGFEDMFSFAEEIGADTLQLKYLGEIPEESAQESSLNGSRPSPYFTNKAESLLLSREQAEFLKAKIEEVKRQAVGSHVNLKTEDIDALSIENLIGGTFPSRRCYQCRFWVVVDPQGNVIPCPWFEDYHLGNVREQPFETIWRNESHRNFCQTQKAGGIGICRHCSLNPTRNYTVYEGVRRKWRVVHQRRRLEKQAKIRNSTA